MVFLALLSAYLPAGAHAGAPLRGRVHIPPLVAATFPALPRGNPTLARSPLREASRHLPSSAIAETRRQRHMLKQKVTPPSAPLAWLRHRPPSSPPHTSESPQSTPGSLPARSTGPAACARGRLGSCGRDIPAPCVAAPTRPLALRLASGPPPTAPVTPAPPGDLA